MLSNFNWCFLQWPFKMRVHNTSGGFLWFSFALSSSILILCKYTSILGSQRRFYISVCSSRFPFCSEEECLSLLTLLKTTQGTCILLLYTWVTFTAKSKWIGGFFWASRLFLLFYFFFLDHFSWVFLVTRVNLLFTDSVCVLSSRSKCGERDELSPKRIKIEVRYWDSFILTYLC